MPWLSESATEGAIPANTELPIACTFSGAGLSPGLRLAQLKLLTDTPYKMPPVPVDFTVRFLDVADGNQFDPSIYAAAGAGVMPGCDRGGVPVLPDGAGDAGGHGGFHPAGGARSRVRAGAVRGSVRRRARRGYNADYIQSFYDEGYTVGCGGGNFCPEAVHTRAQTAVFILKGKHGTSYVPPSCETTHAFDDVPCPATPEAPFGDWIGELSVEGITAGCGGNNFCPTAGIPNQQMAAFLVKAFGIPHL